MEKPEKVFLRNDWVYIEEKGKYMHTSLFSDGTVMATKDLAFPSEFNGVKGYYATDQEGYMVLGYVFYQNNLYYFQPSGPQVGRLLSSCFIKYKGSEHEIDEYGRIQGDLKIFFDNAKIYTMGLLSQK